MRAKLLSVPFFTGLAVGLVALSWLGASLRSRGLADDFVRFHASINVEAGYFPTIRQAAAIVDARPAKVHVIVGGSSTLYGVGQHRSLVWTKHLQDLLGPEYRVINFAQRGGGPNDFANFAVERLIKSGRPVIYIADSNLAIFATPLEITPNRQAVFDAWFRGDLLPLSERTQSLWDSVVGNPAMRAAAIGSALNAILNFDELWNYVGYEWFGSIWSPLLARSSVLPRRLLGDQEAMPDALGPNGLYERSPLDLEMRIVRGEMTEEPSRRAALERDLGLLAERMLPPEVRRRTIVTIKVPSPYYTARLLEAERPSLERVIEAQRQALSQNGFRPLAAGTTFDERDYIDRVHYSVAGGAKLAAEVAPVVRSLAAELGYLK